MSLEISKNAILNALNNLKPKKSEDVTVKTPIDMTSDNSRTRRARQNEPQWDYTLGPREGNTRLITPDAVATVSNSSTSYNAVRNTRISTADDGRISSSRQSSRRGDCYLLAEINAISNTQGGQALLSNNIRKNSNGSYTVTLPGAIKIRQQYAREGKRCDVTGTYNISKEAVDKAIRNAGLTYAQGDVDIILFELAMESYRAEMAETNRKNPNSNRVQHTAEHSAAEPQNRNNDDYLGSGRTYDAGYILTGKKSELYFSSRKHQNSRRYCDGEFGYLTRAEMYTHMAQNNYKYKSIPQVSSSTSSEYEFREMLSELEGNEDQFAITCSVRVQRGEGATANDGNHAITVVRITDNFVYCSNPWHPDQIEPIPRQEFERMAYQLQAVPVRSNPSRINNQPQQGNRPPSNNMINNLVGRLQGQFNPQKPVHSIKPKSLSTLINKYNSNRRDGTNDTNSMPLNSDEFVRIFNNVSKTELTQEERDKLTALFQKLASGELLVAEDFSAMDYFREKYSN